ncbi:MAG: sulfurtransferase TusA family protein [Nitrospirae bacterium]|nr:sulfurtransferase TusA family protein [Nitrospirota bacterium]
MAKIELNFRGMTCPMPIMKISIAVKKGAPGDVFEAVCDDAGFEADVKAWCKETGNELRGITKSGKDIAVTIVRK